MCRGLCYLTAARRGRVTADGSRWRAGRLRVEVVVGSAWWLVVATVASEEACGSRLVRRRHQETVVRCGSTEVTQGRVGLEARWLCQAAAAAAAGQGR